ncbi:hypothetical protein GF366_04730 [Candidatus Peregrinibacteria bacterium]|nr:hypothetical protein [Candidatus Peregrinibacteria bacterium]
MINENYDKLIQYALRILSKKSYTESEMRKKLARYANKRNITGENYIESVIDRLFELDYLDDSQFVKNYVRQRINIKPRGKALIKRELLLKGVSQTLIENIYREIEIDEVKMAIDLLSSRLPRLMKYPIKKQKGKAYQFLYSKGFAKDAIYKAIESCYTL